VGKNIVICIDGTGNQFGPTNSSVIKLYSALTIDDRQLAYYHPGVGTMGAPNALTRPARCVTKLLGLAFGYGLTQVLVDCYTFLMDCYEPGDKIYLFGFSRGAYLCRALAAMLHLYGAPTAGNHAQAPYVVRMLMDSDIALAKQFRATFSRRAPLHFVGLFDTVSSVGWVYDPLTLPYTYYNPSIKIGRHAISIDERRCFYRQNLWREPAQPWQDQKQVWFAGAHSDIGGGYPEAESGLSKIPLQWIFAEAEKAGLRVDAKRRDAVLGADPAYAPPSVTGELHRSLKGLWWLLEFLPKPYWDLSGDCPRRRWRIPLGQPRHIKPNAAIDASVLERMEKVPAYRPPNLPRS